MYLELIIVADNYIDRNQWDNLCQLFLSNYFSNDESIFAVK